MKPDECGGGRRAPEKGVSFGAAIAVKNFKRVAKRGLGKHQSAGETRVCVIEAATAWTPELLSELFDVLSRIHHGNLPSFPVGFFIESINLFFFSLGRVVNW